jgi:septal ring factor EnvC (AmiA/AmiB activator)
MAATNMFGNSKAATSLATGLIESGDKKTFRFVVKYLTNLSEVINGLKNQTSKQKRFLYEVLLKHYKETRAASKTLADFEDKSEYNKKTLTYLDCVIHTRLKKLIMKEKK